MLLPSFFLSEPFKIEKVIQEPFKMNLFPFSGVSEQIRYYGMMTNLNTGKTCKYMLQDFDDTDEKKIMLNSLGFDRYSESYINLKSNKIFSLVDRGDMCSSGGDF